MSALQKLPVLRVPPTITLVTNHNVGDPWLRATDKQRKEATLWAALLEPIAQDTGSVESSIAWLLMKGRNETLPMAAQDAYSMIGKGLSLPNLRRKLKAYKTTGKTGLLPAHTGRVRQAGGWEAAFIEAFNAPSKPAVAGVYKLLLSQGYEVSYSQALRFQNTLPTRIGRNGIERMGKALFHLKHENYTERHTDNMPAGAMLAGDGHTIDCYLSHPNTGGLYRPELTVFLDIVSRKPIGWWLGNSESAIDTIRALGHGMAKHDHVPPMLYLDNGPGYHSKMMSAEGTGFTSQFGMTVTVTWPGNPHGKGWIERFFRTVRDDHDKLFDGGQWYCGDDMAKETNRRLSVDVKADKRKPRSIYEYTASLEAYFERYCNTPMKTLDGKTPNEVWTARLQRVPTNCDVAMLTRPAAPCKVDRTRVRLHGRQYHHRDLIDYQGKELAVKYDLHSDKQVWIYDDKGRFICQAGLVEKTALKTDSVLNDVYEKANKAALQRLENKVLEQNARQNDAITTDMRMSAIDSLSAAPPDKLIAPRAKAGHNPFKNNTPVQDVPYVHPADEVSDDDFDIDLTDYQS